MFRNIKSFFTKTKSTLFTFNNEPFSKFSILFIIILDIFLLVTILTGIDSEKEMSPKIYVKYPSVCQNHFNVDSQNNSKSDGTFPFIEYNDFFIASNLAYNSRENIPIHEDRRA
ncbi:MAG: hypothetical protein U9O24_08830, partial [Campylobacterota bacterium]|nr:hypothetical protein [Campylobacterota bacterium]